jgi:cytochrome c-type biogenesis protein
MDTTSPFFWGLALAAGALTVLSPCILPVVPLLLGRSLQSHRLGPVFLVLGLAGGFAIAGSLLGLASSWLGSVATLLRNIAVLALLGLGLWAMFPQVVAQVSYNFQSQIDQWYYRYKSRRKSPYHHHSSQPASPSRFNKIRPDQRSPRPPSLWGEFWIGTQLGILWSPCAGPVLGSIIVLAAVKHQVVTSFGLLLLYGLGAGIPLLVLAYAGRGLSQRLIQLRPHSSTIQRIGGVLVTLTAIAVLLGWDMKLQLLLAPLFPSVSL